MEHAAVELSEVSSQPSSNEGNTMTKKMMYLIAALVVVGSIFLAVSGDGKSPIAPADVQKLIQKDSTVVLLDVRTKTEFESETGHLAGAELIPVQELEERVGELTKYKDRTIVVYCRTGRRSTTATDILQKRGFNALNMTGGITRWRQEGLPVENFTPPSR